ncbi:GumC family protein [Aquimarina sp. 2201CG5-10]|uniref:GumC family protein n=1 Tax=Aquimarina callyspongiae TaxID=3098150 RepID=UPI002AB43B1B|nr:polysaccharide biosynthesis tyrosine autokinase [Aquimarina sp. 2201CG5-10]MDY8136883.1 polysaccharide biosynthesis tyrosine autokinase [Aquimarina sp. 2201CG5-10]
MNYEIDEDSENLFVKELLERYISNWKLFVIAFAISFVVGFFYLRYTPKLYRVTSTILIRSEKNGIKSELAAFEDLTIFKNETKEVENEIEIIKSRPLLENVVKNLELNVQYFSKTRYSKRLVEFSENIPIKVEFLDDSFYQQGISLIVNILSQKEYAIIDSENNIIAKGEFGTCLYTPQGDININPNFNVIGQYLGSNVHVQVTPLIYAVERYKSSISIGLTNQNTSVVTLTMTTIAKERAVNILNNLIEEYNKDIINDKNQISSNTATFIQERLDIINEELENLEKNLESFKTDNKLTDLTSEGYIMLEKASETERYLTETYIQMGLTDFLLDYMQKTKNELLPVNLGFSDLTAVESINKYNEIALQRNRLIKISGEQNPLIVNFNQKLADLRLSIQQSLKNLKKTLELKLKEFEKREASITAGLSTIPEKKRKLRDIKRQQQIKETLFLYLLEKREEAAISLAATVSNVKVIEKAYATLGPIKPKKNIVFLTGLLVSIIVPIVIVFFKDLLDTKIRDVKDLKKKLKLPLIGSIPKSDNKELVTPSADRSILAESFRLMETNLDFLLSHSKKKGKTVLITSSVKGEGKSFAASNLGVTLGRSGKKVALLDMDLRSAQLKERMEIDTQKGITNFIKNEELTIEDVFSNMEGFKNLDVFTSGPKPPNPAELLKHPRIDDLFEQLKKKYDFILIDTPPITVVADTLLLSSYTHLCIYVVRQKYSDKRLLDIPKTLVQEKRFSSLAILFNDIDFSKGYGYGYGYEYGYGYGERRKSSLFRKIIRGYFGRK